MTDLATVAPAFVEMAHRIVWCTVATTGADGRPAPRPPPHLGVGRHHPHRVDRDLPAVAQGGRPGRTSRPSRSPTGPHPRHLHRRLRHRLGDLRRRAAGGLGSLRRRPGAGGLRPVDHPAVDEPERRGLRDPAPPPDAPPRAARRGDAGGTRRPAPHLAGLIGPVRQAIGPWWSQVRASSSSVAARDRGLVAGEPVVADQRAPVAGAGLVEELVVALPERRVRVRHQLVGVRAFMCSKPAAVHQLVRRRLDAERRRPAGSSRRPGRPAARA